MPNASWTRTRNAIGFWILGLCNNYGYVIMLSAAEDILRRHHLAEDRPMNQNGTCLEDMSSWKCETKSTGIILIADTLPSLICKLIFPFFMHRIHFGIRHKFICLLQAASYVIVAFSTSEAISIFGVVLGSASSGVGEITYLGLSAFFPISAVAAWSSGTGGAGIFGSLFYAILTEPKIFNLTPETTLLVQLVVPLVFYLTFYFVLESPKFVQNESCDPRNWIISQLPEVGNSASDTEAEAGQEKVTTESHQLHTIQRNMNFVERLQVTKPLLHLMIPVSLVYFGEYMINQGLTQLLAFNCSGGLSLTIASQYRWYQVLYQLGVFLSRSSIKIFELPTVALYWLAVLQLLNFAFLFVNAVYWFIPHILLLFAIIFYEGLIGGASYVNTFSRIHKEAPPDVVEYSMSIATLGDTIGINFAGILSIPMHNWICQMKMTT